MHSSVRLDDATLGLFERDLEVIETELDREETSDLPFADGTIVPLDIENKPWARTITYRRVTRVGHFKLVRSYPTDIPMINVLSEEFTFKVHRWAGGYWFSEDDIEAAVKGEIQIEQEDIAGVQESSRQKMNDLIAFGDKSLNLPGFVNHPDALHSFSPYRLDSSSTPQQCLAVLHDAVTSVVELTRQIEKPDTMILPLRAYHYLANTQVSDHLNTTILKQFLDTSPYIKDIQPLNELAGAGVDGTNILMVFRRDKMKVKVKIMQELTWKPLQRKGLGYERAATFKFAGVIARRPYSMHVVAGI
ncbi:DUF2184 domain-containing protein [Leptolyngbya sp. FACHB-541]|uniref:major capsid family protein n=1 Tax=Leptolyngbya sp. FACHB-541 TaxID=2692810 RepID=UPI00168434F5|nr:major capsid family protein [Leptolyngbya sp. FACHB-541]MBD1995302.1 DUF2184 domain-containing protein [Leptolyngbya sp. FACHB-541]